MRAELDDRVDTPFGRRAVDAELKGIPVRVEVGPRDLAEGSVTVARRIAGGKTSVPLGAVAEVVVRRARRRPRGAVCRRAGPPGRHTTTVATIDEAAEAARTGWARIPWSTLGPEGEAQLAESGVTVRCLTLPDGSVPRAEDDPDVLAVVGRAY